MSDAGVPAASLDEFSWRPAEAGDAILVGKALDDWWDQRLRHCVQPQLLEHFGDTALIVEAGGELVAFLIGWFSQRFPEVAYVHFMGVRNDYRRRGLGGELYRRFAALSRAQGRTVLRAETGSFNQRSVAFHRSMGFTIEAGDEVIDGVAVKRDTIGIGGDYVVFSMDLCAGLL